MTKIQKIYTIIMSFVILFTIISGVYSFKNHNHKNQVQTIIKLNINNDNILKEAITLLQKGDKNEISKTLCFE